MIRHFSRPVLQALMKWRNEHISNMTWMPPRTRSLDRRAQPCCTESSCNPFPTCCDCPSASYDPLEWLGVSKSKKKSHFHQPTN